MDALELGLRLGAGVALTALNALFVLTEFALTRAPAFGEDAFRGSKALRITWKMTRKLEVYLTGCQLGISSTSVLLGIVAEPAVTSLMRPLARLVGLGGTSLQVTSVALAVVVINLVHKIWGEQAPTYFGVEAPLKAARLGAPFVYLWTRAFYPLVMAGDGIAKLTLRPFGIEVTRSWTQDAGHGPKQGDHQGADRGAQGNGRAGREADAGRRGSEGPRAALLRALTDLSLEPERRDEVLAAFDIADIPVEDIMVPREAIECLSTRRSLAENLEVIRRSPKSRYPLCDGDLDDAVGVVYVPALVTSYPELSRGERSLRDVAFEALWVDATTTVDRFVDTLQQARQEIALVRRDGKAVGLLTQTDAFERVVGALEDPLDRLPAPPPA